jgi:hypothetical protein
MKVSTPLNAPSELMYLFDKHGVIALSQKDNKLKTVGCVDTTEFFDHFTSDRPVESGLLEKECIYFARKQVEKQTVHMFVLEYEPQLIEIFYKHYDDDSDNEITLVYKIPLPFVQFYLSFHEYNTQFVYRNSYISCTQKKLSSLEDRIYSLPVNNIHITGSICWGADTHLNFRTGENICSYAKRVCNSFFSIPFNSDLRPVTVPVGLEAYNIWAVQTLDFVLNDTTFRSHPMPNARSVIDVL